MINRIGTVSVGLVVAVLVTASPSAIARSGPDDDRSYRAGIGLLNKGLNDLAVTEFHRYLEEHPEGPEATNARYSLAVCLTRLSKYAEASKELGVVVDVEGFRLTADALLLLAQCQVSSGDDRAAESVLKRLVDNHPTFDQADRAHAMLGEVSFRLGKLDESGTILRKVIAKWPQSLVRDRVELFAAMVEAAKGDFKLAAERSAALQAKSPKGEYTTNAALVEAQCRQQMQELSAAAKLYEAASAGTGAVRAQALLGLASVHRSQGDLERAERALSQATAESVPAELRELLSLEQGKLLLQQGNAKEAQAALSEARKAGSESTRAEASYWFAKCQIKQGRVEEAVANLELAAERFERSEFVSDMLFERAAALSNIGDSRALDAWRDWRGRFADSELAPEAMLAEAWCSLRLERFAECEKLCKDVASKYPDRARSESFELLVAESAFGTARFEPAMAGYSSFLERYPGSRHAWRCSVRRSMCLVKLGRGVEAAAALDASSGAAGEQDQSLRRAAVALLADYSFGASDWAGAERWLGMLVGEKGSKDELLDALLRLGICVERQKKFTESLPIFERILKEGAGTAQALQAQFERAQSLLELERVEEAKRAFEAVAQSEGEGDLLKAHAMRHLAGIASREGRHDEAAKILSTLHGAAGSATGGESTVELGSALLAAGKYEEAEQAFAEVVNAQPKAEVAGRASILRGIAINRQGRHEEALAQLKSSTEVQRVDADTLANGRYEMAIAFRSLGRDSEAAESLRLVIGQAPTRIECHARIELAQIQIKAQEYDKALSSLEDCVGGTATLSATDGAMITERAMYLRAVCLLQSGRPKDAADTLKSFAKAFAGSPLIPSAHLVRGEALLASGEAREAATELSEAVGGKEAEVQPVALLRLGEAWAACQDWTKSEQTFELFLDRFANSPLWFQARFGQGWARENQARHDHAIEAYRDVAARHTGATAARAQFQIGECLYAQKKYEQAVAELIKTDVLFAYPEWSAAALYEAGRCLAEMNRIEESSKQFDEVVRRFPESKWAKLATERLSTRKPEATPGRFGPKAASSR